MRWTFFLTVLDLVYGFTEIRSTVKLVYLGGSYSKVKYSYAFFDGELTYFTCELLPTGSTLAPGCTLRWDSDIFDKFWILGEASIEPAGKINLLMSSKHNAAELTCHYDCDEDNDHSKNTVKFVKDTEEYNVMEERKVVSIKGFDEERLELISSNYIYVYHFIPRETLTISCSKIDDKSEGYTQWSTYPEGSLEINHVIDRTTYNLTLDTYHKDKIILCNYYKHTRVEKYPQTVEGDIISVYAYIKFVPDGKVPTTTTTPTPATTKKTTTEKPTTTTKKPSKTIEKPKKSGTTKKAPTTTAKKSQKKTTKRPQTTATKKAPTTTTKKLQTTTTKKPQQHNIVATTTPIETTKLKVESTSLAETSDECYTAESSNSTLCGVKNFKITGYPEYMKCNGYDSVLEYTKPLEMTLTCHKNFTKPGVGVPPSLSLRWEFDGHKVGDEKNITTRYINNTYTFNINIADSGKEIKCIYGPEQKERSKEIKITLQYTPPPAPAPAPAQAPPPAETTPFEPTVNNLNQDIIYIVIPAVVCIVVLILLVYAVRRFRHKTNEERKANELLYENLSNENSNTNQFPANLEDTYARPLDYTAQINSDEPYAVAGYQNEDHYTVPYVQDVSKLYAKPVPKSTRDLYAKPIPKSQRIKHIIPESAYAEITPKKENHYEEIAAKQITYAEIDTSASKPSSSCRKADETPYSTIIGIVKKKPKSGDDAKYLNAQTSRYVNSNANDTEYVEPAYCELNR